MFLESAAGLIKQNPQKKLRFKIIGDGELRSELEEYSSRLNINSQVDFLGWQKDLACVYRDLDIVVLTSINEGTPVSLIEAMASGRPVVATDVGGVRDLLGKGIDINRQSNGNFEILERGIIVTSRDYNGFTSALIFLSEHDRLKIEMGMRGREFVMQRFTKGRLIKDIEDLYVGLLNSEPNY